MLREKEIAYFRNNVLPYYVQQVEEQEELERIYQERKKARIKYMREVEEAKRLKREQKLQEKEQKRIEREQQKQLQQEQKKQEKAQIKVEKQLLKMKIKQEKAKIIQEQKELLKQNIETELEKLEVFKEKSLQNLIEDGSEETRLASGKYKRCSKCGEVLKLTEFYKHPLKKQGVFDYCKACAKLENMKHRKNKTQQEILERMLA